MDKETLEDAAKNKYPIENTGDMFMPNRHDVNKIYRQEGFIEGAKWQAERMYSQEEVVNLLNKREDYLGTQPSIFDYSTNEEWFEQFKKK